MYEVKSDKVDLYAAKRDGYESPTIHAAPRKELTVRSKKAKAGDRVSKGDGSVVLVCLLVRCLGISSRAN